MFNVVNDLMRYCNEKGVKLLYGDDDMPCSFIYNKRDKILIIKRNRPFIFISNDDSHDWMNKGIEYEINRVLNNKNLQNGSIILFHNDAKYTPQCLDTIIKGLKDKGYEIVPLSQLIHKENYYMDHAGRQKLK